MHGKKTSQDDLTLRLTWEQKIHSQINRKFSLKNKPPFLDCKTIPCSWEIENIFLNSEVYIWAIEYGEWQIRWTFRWKNQKQDTSLRGTLSSHIEQSNVRRQWRNIIYDHLFTKNIIYDYQQSHSQLRKCLENVALFKYVWWQNPGN